MGTSGSYGGSKNGLLPTWLTRPDGGADPPAAAPASAPPGVHAQPAGPTPTQSPTVQPSPISSPPFSGSFGNARAAFTRYARSHDSAALGSALSRYVNRGAGGGRRAAAGMGASRAVASRLVGVARDVQTAGAVQTLQRYGLGQLAGRPAADVFLSLMEVMCPPGGSISEAISRQAMLAAIEHLAEAGATDFDALTPAQWEEFILDFISCSVEEKVVSEIGTHLIDIPETIAELDALENQLHDFVSGCVREALADKIPNLSRLTDADIAATVETVYEAAFDYLSLLRDGS